MKKYNLSKIMATAWAKYRESKKWVDKLSFAECLRRSWKDAKAEIEKPVQLEKITNRNFEIGRILYGCLVYMRRGLVAEAGQMGWILSGKTYPIKKVIKEMGFRWDCESRNWYTQDINGARIFAA